jgi:hypothetical protein
VITTVDPLPTSTSGLAYFTQLQASGGALPLRWTVTGGTLPTGLTLNPYSGVISGIPTAAGTSITVTATDENGSVDTMVYTLPFVSGAPVALAIVGTLPPAHPGVPYSATLQATGGAPPYTFSLVGSASWLSFDATTHTLFGTPDNNPIGLIQVQVADSFPVTPATALSNPLVVVAPFSIVQTSLGGAGVGAGYTETLTTTGATAPVVWTLTSGSLPSGLSIDSATGTISGTAAVAGTSTFQIQAADAVGNVSQRQFSVTIGGSTGGGSSGGGGGGGGCGLLGAELLLVCLLRKRRKA